ncbi:uncharacterized protein LOC129762722 [Toxorhynchites rutilus septentrionalis]|uniref:uncharacterized protein LOC129762722 n=1 Tax=Toxorhynchites rutilus septentrionalis TaxID=329112 RepID=UPI002478B9B0|nr:uncharacterized protein LOC129762722 [Toxorhynchites rutilus septentrionalis]
MAQAIFSREYFVKMKQFSYILLSGVVLLGFLQANSGYTLTRVHRQSGSPAESETEGSDSRAGIPGLSEIQAAIDAAQFLISIGQQVIPAILQSLTSQATMDRMSESQRTQLFEIIRKGIEVMAMNHQML